MSPLRRAYLREALHALTYTLLYLLAGGLYTGMVYMALLRAIPLDRTIQVGGVYLVTLIPTIVCVYFAGYYLYIGYMWIKHAVSVKTYTR